MKIGLSSLSLFPLPVKKVLRLASQSGFDFVEVFLFGRWTRDDVARTIGVAALLGLELHWHQVWTTDSSEKKEQWANWILTALGRLPRDGYKTHDWVPPNARPLIAYADRVIELSGRENIWFQVIAEQRSLTDPAPRFSCKDFLQKARGEKLPLVLDTMHFLEYRRDASGIERHPLEPKEILTEWSKFWCEFHSQVQEIHWNDFTSERNLWPGTGTAPLREFAQTVRASGWDECIVPEVRPRLLFPYGAKELLALRKKMDEYFDCSLNLSITTS